MACGVEASFVSPGSDPGFVGDRVRLDVSSFLLSRPEITKEPPPAGEWPLGVLFYWNGWARRPIVIDV